MLAATKARAHQVIDDLPENATLEDLLQEPQKLLAIERAMTDREAGRLIPHEEAKARVMARFRQAP